MTKGAGMTKTETVVTCCPSCVGVGRIVACPLGPSFLCLACDGTGWVYVEYPARKPILP